MSRIKFNCVSTCWQQVPFPFRCLRENGVTKLKKMFSAQLLRFLDLGVSTMNTPSVTADVTRLVVGVNAIFKDAQIECEYIEILQITSI